MKTRLCVLGLTAAISGLSSMDDARASQQLASLIHDADPTVAQAAISSSYNGGPEVDTALEQYPRVWAAGGIPHAVFPTTFAELVRLTRGTPAAVA